MAVAASGVWVIDAKRYTGRVAVTRPLLGRPRLTIDGRDRSALVDGLAGQVAVVRAALHDVAPEAPLHGALCLVDAELPPLGTLTFGGHPILRPRALAKRISAPGALAPAAAVAIFAALAERLPAA
jgi:hypothetical protein